MIRLLVNEVCNLFYSVEYFVKQTEKPEWTAAIKAEVKRGLQRSVEHVRQICPRGAQLTIERLIRDVDSMDVEQAKRAAIELRNRINEDTQGVFFLLIPSDREHYYTNPQPFNEDGNGLVAANFPRGNGEAIRAGKCYALDQYTASVFHLMRVMEIALHAFSSGLGIPSPARGTDRNWGAMLRTIRSQIDNKPSGWPDKEFYEDGYRSFDRVREQWRNPTMHIERDYNDVEAKDVFNAVSALMRRLATKLKE
jgi:hypothetical protein